MSLSAELMNIRVPDINLAGKSFHALRLENVHCDDSLIHFPELFLLVKGTSAKSFYKPLILVHSFPMIWPQC